MHDDDIAICGCDWLYRRRRWFALSPVASEFICCRARQRYGNFADAVGMTYCGTIRCATRSRKLHLTWIDSEALYPIDTSGRDELCLKQWIIPSNNWPSCQWYAYLRALFRVDIMLLYGNSIANIMFIASRISMALNGVTTRSCTHLGLHWQCCVNTTHTDRSVFVLGLSAISIVTPHAHALHTLASTVVEYFNECCFLIHANMMVAKLLCHFAVHTPSTHIVASQHPGVTPIMFEHSENETILLYMYFG